MFISDISFCSLVKVFVHHYLQYQSVFGEAVCPNLELEDNSVYIVILTVQRTVQKATLFIFSNNPLLCRNLVITKPLLLSQGSCVEKIDKQKRNKTKYVKLLAMVKCN